MSRDLDDKEPCRAKICRKRAAIRANRKCKGPEVGVGVARCSMERLVPLLLASQEKDVKPTFKLYKLLDLDAR